MLVNRTTKIYYYEYKGLPAAKVRNRKWVPPTSKLGELRARHITKERTPDVISRLDR
jgi:hypothetical protein